jgi:hypothetical protein
MSGVAASAAKTAGENAAGGLKAEGKSAAAMALKGETMAHENIESRKA